MHHSDGLYFSNNYKNFITLHQLTFCVFCFQHIYFSFWHLGAFKKGNSWRVRYVWSYLNKKFCSINDLHQLKAFNETSIMKYCTRDCTYYVLKILITTFRCFPITSKSRSANKAQHSRKDGESVTSVAVLRIAGTEMRAAVAVILQWLRQQPGALRSWGHTPLPLPSSRINTHPVPSLRPLNTTDPILNTLTEPYYTRF